ncbi:NAD(P)H-binding protein [uncultured Martelella sp.]|uniref:NAD(P)-dependent oxidoreductase n=1 Tax=uncultured Martelella sp. TaxID=392331 RepID=UPI0029C9A7A6|nr:NAD(P)H-binding protein [uncultured Martelella sp.]
MKLLVIGATGMVGSRIVDEALSRGHEVVAATRNPDRIQPRAGLTAEALDVTDVKRLGELAASVDTVISATSPRSSGNPEAEAVSYASALIEALGKTRLVMVGGAGSLNLPDGTPVADVVPDVYAAEARAMRAAYERIKASDLDYTVQAPAGEIAPGERTGQFRLQTDILLTDADGNSRISAEDFAVALLNEVEQPQFGRQLFTAAY